jgi:hypothetical protein
MKRQTFLAGFLAVFAMGALIAPAAAQNHAQHYVLDGFGGVHAGGGAPVISPGTPYFGWDVAVSVEYVAVGTATATGDGLLVLDAFGGVHEGGALVVHPPGGSTPYFGFDAARDLTLRNVPPRAAGSFLNGALVTSAATWTILVGTTIRVPDDGWLVVTGSTELHCAGAGSVSADFALAINGTTPPTGYDMLQQIPDCAAEDSRIFAGTYMFSVLAGTHTVSVLGRRVGGTPSLTYTDRSVTVVFVDRDPSGSS